MTPLSRRSAVLALGGAAFLSPVLLPGFVRAADTQAVVQPIAALDDGLIAVMKAGKSTPFAQRYQMLVPVVRSSFDLPAILAFSVGMSAWNEFSTQQQGLLLREFTRYTVASYLSSFNNYDGQRFDISPTLRPYGSQQIVTTTLVPPHGKPTRIDYVMRNVGGSWKIGDVLLDGTISRVAVQRSDFRSVVGSSGAPGLIGLLQRKVSDLSSGAMT